MGSKACAGTPSGATRRRRPRPRSSARLPRTRDRLPATSTSAARSCRPTVFRDVRLRSRRVFEDDLYQQLWAYEPMWHEASRLTTKARSPYEATITDRALAAVVRRVRLRRTPTGVGRCAAPRRLPRAHQARLLPAVRGDDGAHASLPRHSGPRRRRVHERGRGRTAPGPSPITTHTPGSKRGSRGTAGSRSIRRPGVGRCRRRTRTPLTRPTQSGLLAPEGSSIPARSRRQLRVME